MKTKSKNPYQRLVEEVRQWAFNVKYRKRKTMWSYPGLAKGGEPTGYRLDDLYQRVAAADQLGYDVQLTTSTEGALLVQYVKRLPEAPWAVRPE